MSHALIEIGESPVTHHRLSGWWCDALSYRCWRHIFPTCTMYLWCTLYLLGASRRTFLGSRIQRSRPWDPPYTQSPGCRACLLWHDSSPPTMSQYRTCKDNNHHHILAFHLRIFECRSCPSWILQFLKRACAKHVYWITFPTRTESPEFVAFWVSWSIPSRSG